MNDFINALDEDIRDNEIFKGYESTNDFAKSVVNFSNMTLQDGLPEDLQKEKSLESFKDITGLAKSYVETKKMMGKSVKIPDENTSPEDRQAFFSKLGVPRKPEEYTAKMPLASNGKEFPDADQEITDYFIAGAHELNMNNEQTQFGLSVYAKLAQDLMDGMDKEAKDTESALVQEWGNDYEENLKRSDMMIEEYGDKDVRQAIMSAGLSNNAGFVKFMHSLATATMDDKHLDGDNEEIGNIEDEIKALMASDAYDKGDETVHKKVYALIDKKQKMGKK